MDIEQFCLFRIPLINNHVGHIETCENVLIGRTHKKVLNKIGQLATTGISSISLQKKIIENFSEEKFGSQNDVFFKPASKTLQNKIRYTQKKNDNSKSNQEALSNYMKELASKISCSVYLRTVIDIPESNEYIEENDSTELNDCRNQKRYCKIFYSFSFKKRE